jgi:hypothetical protein
MQCLFHRMNPDDESSCLLGGRETLCKVFRCFLTVGQKCSTGHEAHLDGKECGKSLVCGKKSFSDYLTKPQLIANIPPGCDKKCNGCMIVNGKEKCHWSEECMPMGKRSQFKLFPMNEASGDYSIDVPMAV